MAFALTSVRSNSIRRPPTPTAGRPPGSPTPEPRAAPTHAPPPPHLNTTHRFFHHAFCLIRLHTDVQHSAGPVPTAGIPSFPAWSATQDAEDRTHKDLYDAAEEIKARVSDSTIQAKCQAVMDAVDTVILYEWHQRSYKDAHGIGIFWPKEVADLDEPSSPQWNDFQYYQDYLAFSPLTHWDEFLDAYVNGQ